LCRIRFRGCTRQQARRGGRAGQIRDLAAARLAEVAREELVELIAELAVEVVDIIVACKEGAELLQFFLE
jgi:hypothetical protein